MYDNSSRRPKPQSQAREDEKREQGKSSNRNPKLAARVNVRYPCRESVRRRVWMYGMLLDVGKTARGSPSARKRWGPASQLRPKDDSGG